MKKYVIGFVLLVLGLATVYFTQFQTGWGGVYSEGYQMGVIYSISDDGYFCFRSGEAEFYMGFGSSEVKKGDKTINPRGFSMSVEEREIYKELEGQPVFMKYKEWRYAGYARETRYEPVFIRLVNDSIQVETYETANANGSKRDETLIGRVTKASKKGNFVKSFEITVQVASEGSNFKFRSLDDEELYSRILLSMESGKMIKLTSKKKLLKNALTEDTPYEAYKIEPFTK